MPHALDFQSADGAVSDEDLFDFRIEKNAAAMSLQVRIENLRDLPHPAFRQVETSTDPGDKTEYCRSRHPVGRQAVV